LLHGEAFAKYIKVINEVILEADLGNCRHPRKAPRRIPGGNDRL
jgi:hypothetical protein